MRVLTRLLFSHPMANVDRAYNQVRHELAQVGLLADGLYLDVVELIISGDKSVGERGYVFEQVGHEICLTNRVNRV
jgi:hypothetical protein